MNENYLSGKCVYIYISAKYISKDVDVYYSLKKIYSPHVHETFNNLSKGIFSDLYVKSVSKLLRCADSVDVPRVYDLTQRRVFPGLGWSAASWLQFLLRVFYPVLREQFILFFPVPKGALPHCDSMTTRCCLLCGWPLQETLGDFAN